MKSHCPFLAAMAVAVVILLPAAAWSQALWQGLTVGATAEQVLKARPDARRLPNGGGRLADGSTCDVEIPRVLIAGDNFHACFYFKAEALSQVTLKSETPSEAEFLMVVAFLRDKYGPEYSFKKGDISYDVDWRRPDGSNINVIYLFKYGDILNINYQYKFNMPDNL